MPDEDRPLCADAETSLLCFDRGDPLARYKPAKGIELTACVLKICIHGVKFSVCCLKESLNLSAELDGDCDTDNSYSDEDNNIFSHSLAALAFHKFVYHVVPLYKYGY